MTSRDHRGRPVVAVTGIGIVTSLGIGKEDNWAKLTAGQSGIHEITRFPTDGLRTKVAGTIDFIPAEPLCAPALSEEFAMLASQEAVAESGVGRIGDFPGPLFVAVPPVEVEQAEEVDEVRLDEAQPVQPVEFVGCEAQRAQPVDRLGNRVDMPRQVDARRAAAETVTRVRRRVLVQHRLHHRELVQVGVEQRADHVVPARRAAASIRGRRENQRAQIASHTAARTPAPRDGASNRRK